MAQQLTIFVGLVCGHMKSQFFAESFAWQVGLPPDQVSSVDFRRKNPARPASEYDFQATDQSGSPSTRRTLDLLGSNWGFGALQPEACNFCDDIFAETADVVFGDAWLDRFESDWRGTSVVVSRSRLVDQILDEGRREGAIVLEALSADEAAESQAGNFRHRRIGLSVRLADDIEAGLSVPTKRVPPDKKVAPLFRRMLIRQRRRMSRVSLVAFRNAKERGDLAAYLRPMAREILRYKAINKLEKRFADQ